ncbi:MAG: hypothetical protein C0412_01415 [Flavobacterium sp.]|nr:hypothetical protein [Flavobacterium sp.]
MKKIFAILVLVPILFSFTAAPDDEAIKKEIMANSEKSAEYWNKGDVENYMNICYPKREDILMQSTNSRIYGYTKIHDMYVKTFKDEEKRGVLSFSEVEVNVITSDTAMEIGKYTLQFKDGKKRSGYYTAILKKFPEGWRIVHDHS